MVQTGTGPVVTAVVPTKNRATMLGVTLRTILAQRGVDLEVVVVDDGSDAGQAQEVAGLAGGPVRVLRNEVSRGVATARNQGVEAARTPWVAFCDDDDLWAPGKVAAQLAAVGDSGGCWAYTGAVKFELGPVVWQLMPPPTPDEVVERLAWKCVVPAGASNVLADRATFLEVGGFDADLMHMADWDAWLRLLGVGVPATAEGIGVAYRLHPGTMSLNPGGMLRELSVLSERWAHLRGGERLEAGPTHLWIAMSYLRVGRRWDAAASYLRATRTRPQQGLRGVLRTMHPAPPTPAHRTAVGARQRPRFKRVEQVTLPEEMETLLASYAAAPSASEPATQRPRPGPGTP